jgi:glycine/D-amino acid oxidase-like deaminating enzyme
MQRVVIAGGGVIGSASAYFIKMRSPDTTVTVIERDPSYAHASTSLAVGGIRYQFSNRENVQMCFYSAKFLQNISSHLAVQPGENVDVNYHQNSYLFLVGKDASMEWASQDNAQTDLVAENLKIQKEEGCPTAWVNAEDLSKDFPWMNMEGIRGGTITPLGGGEGWFDPSSLLQAFKKKARAIGVNYVKGQVEKFEGGTTVQGVVTSEGERFACDHVVMTVGRHSGMYAKILGVDKHITVSPRKRYVHMVSCPAFDVVRSQAFLRGVPKTRPMAMTIDTSGVFIRPEGDGFLVGTSPHGDEPDPDAAFDDFQVGHEVVEAQWNEVLWPAIANRIPVFENAKLKSSWAGHYDFNRVDHNALVGRIPGAQSNVVWATGFSGHGLMQSPAVGRAVSELIIDGKYTTLDLSRLSAAREDPVFEKNVI